MVKAFYAEIQDSHQKGWEDDFWQKLVDDSAYTLGPKNFIKITVSRTVSEINAFLRFRQASFPDKHTPFKNMFLVML